MSGHINFDDYNGSFADFMDEIYAIANFELEKEECFMQTDSETWIKIEYPEFNFVAQYDFDSKIVIPRLAGIFEIKTYAHFIEDLLDDEMNAFNEAVKICREFNKSKAMYDNRYAGSFFTYIEAFHYFRKHDYETPVHKFLSNFSSNKHIDAFIKEQISELDMHVKESKGKIYFFNKQ